MNLTSSSFREKEITVGETVKLKLDLALFVCWVFKCQNGLWYEEEVFSTLDMTMNEFFDYLEQLEEQVLKDEASASQFQIG
jgi:predicted metal-binding transcription factor (methanogenesis marker protein 9)